VEKEHSDTVGGDDETILGIVLDHLKESLTYYDSLKQMEGGFEK